MLPAVYIIVSEQNQFVENLVRCDQVQRVRKKKKKCMNYAMCEQNGSSEDFHPPLPTVVVGSCDLQVIRLPRLWP